jgi:hypothetical protein
MSEHETAHTVDLPCATRPDNAGRWIVLEPDRSSAIADVTRIHLAGSGAPLAMRVCGSASSLTGSPSIDTMP